MINPRHPSCFWNNEIQSVWWNMSNTCSNTWGLSGNSPWYILKVCFSSRVFDDGRCILNCPSWKFEFESQCHPCHHTCQGCQGSGPSNCTSCGAGEAAAVSSPTSYLPCSSPPAWTGLGLKLDNSSLKSLYNPEISPCQNVKTLFLLSWRLTHCPWGDGREKLRAGFLQRRRKGLSTDVRSEIDRKAEMLRQK